MNTEYSVIQVLPNELYEIFTSATPKSFFYYIKEYGEWSLDKKLVFIDEVEASKDTLPILRSLTGQTKITPRHLSVHEAELLDLIIRGKRVVWFTSVKTFGSEQIKNRFLHFNPDETLEQDKRVRELQDVTRYSDIPDGPFKIMRAMTKIIAENTKDLKVWVPWGIKWPFEDRRWLYLMFCATIDLITKIRFKHRKINEQGYLAAEKEDFELAKQLWKLSAKTIIYRIPKTCEELLEEIPESPEDALTHAELSEILPLSTRHIQRLCLELQVEGLINARKRTREGKGRHSWEYWKGEQPKVEDIEIDEERSLGDLQTKNEKENRGQKDG